MRALARLVVATIVRPGLASAAAITRVPFLQQTSARASLVALNTDVPAAVRVVAELGGGGTVVGESAGTAHHGVRLDALPAGSVFAYRVELERRVHATGTLRTPIDQTRRRASGRCSDELPEDPDGERSTAVGCVAARAERRFATRARPPAAPP